MTDEALYDQLIAPMESRMMRTIWRVVRQSEIAEDTLQDALTIIWRKRDRVRRHPNPQALILKICLNCAHDSLRKRERIQKLQDAARMSSKDGTRFKDGPKKLTFGNAGPEGSKEVNKYRCSNVRYTVGFHIEPAAQSGASV